MFKLEVMSGASVASQAKLLEEVFALDLLNMKPIMDACGYGDFSWDKRLAGLQGPTTQFFAAFKDGSLAGYLEVCRDYQNADGIYLSSIQIHPMYQSSSLFRALLREAFKYLKNENVAFFRTDVQVSNHRMLKIFEKLGFETVLQKSSHTKTISVDARAKRWAEFSRLFT